MALDLIWLEMNTVLKNEGKNGYDQAVEEEVRKQANSDCTDDEEGARPPFQAHWL
jgi:hypothetical protein